MWVIFDCCHSGTALDLKFKLALAPDGRSWTCTKTPSRQKYGAKVHHTQAEVIMISGCKDSQTSADVQAGSLGTTAAAGAMTTALRHVLTPSVSCGDLLQHMRSFLRSNRFDQVPQMSSEQFVQMDCSFVHYQSKRRGKRALPETMVCGPPPPTSTLTCPGITSPELWNDNSRLDSLAGGGVDMNKYLEMVRMNKIQAEINSLRASPISPRFHH